MKTQTVPICLLFLSIISKAKCVSYGATMIDGMRNKLLKLDKTLEYNLFHPNIMMLDVPVDDKCLWVIKTFKDFGDSLEKEISTSGYEYLNPLKSVELWTRAEKELNAIDRLYPVFRTMQNDIISGKARLDVDKLIQFLEVVMHDPNVSIVHTLARINDLIVHEKLFVSAYQESSSQICNENQSLQQLLYNLYSTVTLAEIKGYSMIQFSYSVLRLYNPGTNFTEEMELVKQQYATRTLETLRAVKTAMAFAPRHVWRCDARIPKLNETYTKLTQLFQGYIVNEVDLNPTGTCRENCAYYQYTKEHGCYKDMFCAKQRKCKGRILKCEYIASDMWVCPSSENSDRRYEYVQYDNSRIFGRKDTCTRGTTKVESWWRWLFWHCSYCFCYCDDSNGGSDRYFSLRKVVSDVAKNRVVTGVRFKKVNQIIHIQIQEGELMPRGSINNTSVQWKPIEEFSVLDDNVKSGVDYHPLSWEKRGFDLDDLVLDDDYILTGFKFRMIGPRLNLEVRMTKFNFTTGKLIEPLDRSFWISHDETDRTELMLSNPDIPTNVPALSLPDSQEYQYLNFAPSDRNSDAAQNTIPFIDIQPVESNPPVPIAGAGVYHKGRSNSGGYVALRLITYDFTKHLTVDLPDITETVVNTPNKIIAV